MVMIAGLALSWQIEPADAGQQNRSIGCNAFGVGFDCNRRPAPSATQSLPQYAFGPAAFPPLLDGGPRPLIEARQPERVAFWSSEPAGTIVIDTQARKLYFTLGQNEAYLYPISVGRKGFTWTGTETVTRVADWPDWHPPAEMRERDPRLPIKMTGGIRNPLGAVALFLGNTLYRIHGTNDPTTIGLAASSGCFRMLNEHAMHLASVAHVGTRVKVVPHLVGTDPSEELPWLRKAAADTGLDVNF